MADEKPTGGAPEALDLESGWSDPPAPAAPAEKPAAPAPANPVSEEIPIPPPFDFGASPAPSPAPPDKALENPPPAADPARTAALFPSEPPPRAAPVAAAPPKAAQAAPKAAQAAPAGGPTARRPFDVLSDNVRLGQTAVPFSFVVGGVVLLTAIASIVLGLSLGVGLSSAGRYADSLPSPEASSARSHDAVAAPPAASSSAAQSLSERVMSGEPAALAELEMNGGKALKADQAVLLAQGKAAAVARQAREFRARLDADPTLIEKPDVVTRLREFAASDLTSVEALGAMARLPGPISADLLYEVWTSTSERTPTTELAERLVYSDDVLPKASPALRVALDLRHADESGPCDATLALVRRAAESGDRRALPMLAKLGRKFGCGTRKKDDCYPCLRDGDDLKRAITESRKRPVPKH